MEVALLVVGIIAAAAAVIAVIPQLRRGTQAVWRAIFPPTPDINQCLSAPFEERARARDEAEEKRRDLMRELLRAGGYHDDADRI